MKVIIRKVQQGDANARAFYEANGFALTDFSKPAFDTEEVLYSKKI